MDFAQEENLSVLSTAYWPNLHYFYYVVNSAGIVIDGHEHYEKQSYRNRCRILSANGPLDLSLPVEHPGKRCLIKDVRLSGSSWKAQHFTAIKSAYGKSPFFEYFSEDIHLFYEREFDSLLAFNTAQLQFLLKAFRLKRTIVFSEHYVQVTDFDLRKLIHPKKNFGDDSTVSSVLTKPYYQGFSDRFGFSPNLSMLDLLFNKGLESVAYLQKPL